MTTCQFEPCLRKVWVQRDRFLVEPLCLGAIRLREALEMRKAAQEILIGFRVVGLPAPDPRLFARGELHFKRRHNVLCDVVLQGEDIGELAVVAFGP